MLFDSLNTKFLLVFYTFSSLSGIQEYSRIFLWLSWLNDIYEITMKCLGRVWGFWQGLKKKESFQYIAMLGVGNLRL